MGTNNSLVKTIFIGMISIAVISILLLGILMIHNDYSNFNGVSKELRDEFMESQKAIIKNEVDKAVDYIEYMKSRNKEGLKDNLKSKVDQAYDIAMNIYNENKGRDLKEIKKLVKDALRPIRFSDRRGYYFAVSLDGVIQLSVDRPSIEGRNMLGICDTNGKYFVKDMIHTARTIKEGSCEYTWTKPGLEGNNYSNLTYIRIFEPFSWIIGTGEYIDDAQNNAKELILNRIAEIRFGKDGYIFVVSFDGVTLMNALQRELIGKNIWELTDPNGVKVIQEERKAVENPEGGFISYVWNRPSEAKPAAKISYMKGIKDWEWMVGAGVYVDEIDKIISDKRVLLEQTMRQQLIKVSILLLFLIAATFLTAKHISRRIEKSIIIFSSFFKKAADESVKIDLTGVNFSEFENLAISANSMIDQREHAETSLKENKEKYRTLFNMESDALAMIDIDNGNILDANNAFMDLFGLENEELCNMKEGDFIPASDLSGRQSKTDDEYTIAIYPKKKDGTLFPAEIKARNFEYQGRGVKLLAIRDVSERKKLEAQLRQAHKMEAIGTLAGGIAHDFNNVLLPIMGHAEMLMMGLPPDSHIQYNLQQIYQAGNRAKEMIKQILAFSRKDIQEKKPVRLGNIITDTVKLLRGSLPSTIDIKYDIKTDADTILANSTQIHQVILNLCTNSAYAMREYGGLLKIDLDDFIIDQGNTHRFSNLNQGRYLRLTLSDTGTGMPQDVMEKIFDPYFTTKGIGEGTGMGLAVVHGIVMDHKGDIAVESILGKGTTFSILLPSNKDIEATGPSDRKISDEMQKGDEKILLVDDERIVVDVLKSMLENLGYDVTARTSSVEALEVFHNNPNRFDLVITDMTMPNMTGKDLSVEILSIRPDMPVILSTGFSERIDEESARAIGIKAFVMKPVAMNDLARAIRIALDKKGSTRTDS